MVRLPVLGGTPCVTAVTPRHGVPPGSHPETRSVRGNNFCRMAIFRPQGGATLVVSSVIDNLVKGAAGQAVQNMNLMLGFPERQGLDLIALSP